MPFDFSSVGKLHGPYLHSHTWKDCALYALSVGATKEELSYLYENTKGGMLVLPTFGLVHSFDPMKDVLSSSKGNLEKLVHGFQRISVPKPLRSEDTYSTTSRIVGIYDYRKFASMVVETESRNAQEELCVSSRATLFFLGEGGFGGELPPKEKAYPSLAKDSEPQGVWEEKTSPEQALLYRLNGDTNPLHADPEFAHALGFEGGPLLHGLCTFGFLARHVAKLTGKLYGVSNESVHVGFLDGQFKKPVWPSDTLQTRLTEVFSQETEGDGEKKREVHFALEVWVKERSEVVFSAGYAKVFF